MFDVVCDQDVRWDVSFSQRWPKALLAGKMKFEEKQKMFESKKPLSHPFPSLCFKLPRDKDGF